MRRRAALPLLAVPLSLTLAATLLAPAAAAASEDPPAAPADESSSQAASTGNAGVERGDRRTATTPTLVARATLSADTVTDGPPSGALATPANGRQGPFPGQVVPGFSGMVDAGDGTFWALPDNGFGTKANSADFLLRVYRVTPQWQTADGGPGALELGEHLSLSDPDRHVDFPIVHDATPERLLTGADFDVESIVRAPDGTFWIGEEFGPFVLHVDADGALLAPPVPLPDAKSPQNPYLAPGETPRLRASNGFEALAGSPDGKYLYPITEGAFVDDPDQRRRTVYQLDTRTGEYTGRTWAYQTDRVANVVGDAFMTSRHELLVVERDNFDGPASVTKRVYGIDLRHRERDGYLEKTLVLDALKIANPEGIGAGDGYGTGDPFAFPVQSFETVVRLADGRLLIANDNNYPGNAARVPGTPDDTEVALVELRRTRAERPGDITVVGHRGASGYRPEHTLAAYETAILQCADYIEPDLVSTKDGVLVARHENEIGGTTDVATRPEFADRKVTKTIDGAALTGWFTEDFTLAELRTLRAKERIPATRPANTAFDGLYEIPTLDEVLDLARRSTTCDGQQVGVYPETKHPTYFDSIGLSLEEPFVGELKAARLDGRKAPVIVQSFETGNLRELDRMTGVRLAQLVSCSGAPYDLVAAGDPRTYADLVTRAGLRDVARYADGVGLCKDVMIPRAADGTLGQPTRVIADAHRAGLVVHGWTFRAENQFLPADFRSSADPNAYGDLAGEIRAFVDAGMDGLFSDHPDLAVAAVG
ncbi:esterase-like activity of phytase family protein [Cellulomonas sp. 179-A 4D5 NHS]|uniref:esterase-like activity of phytase family protein n=1 Tax=Cellulomonas sp. 179-A 4D5 NHS TaxID=3142378 RepID=UPI0039A1619E